MAKATPSRVREVVGSIPHPSQDPNCVDLRFFRKISLSDSYNGIAPPENGGAHAELILYGRHLVSLNVSNPGIPGHAREEGHAFMKRMYRISKIWNDILLYARWRRGFDKEFYAKHSEVNLEAYEFVLMTEAEHAILGNHPQFFDLMEEYKIHLKKYDAMQDPPYQILLNEEVASAT